jgi:aminopeptidase
LAAKQLFGWRVSGDFHYDEPRRFIMLFRGNPVSDSRVDKLAQVLVRYSTAVQPGNVVSLTGPPPAEPLMVALYREVLRAGGYPVVFMVPETCTEILYRHGNAGQLAFIDRLQTWEVRRADVCIHLVTGDQRGGQAAMAVGKRALHQQARRPLLDRFLRRAGEKSLRWLAVQVPSGAAARGAGLALADFEDLVYRAGRLDREDPVAAWHAVSQKQARLMACLQQGKDLRLMTPSGTDLRLGITGRAWINGDGRQNFPDGEVFTAPLEHATEGLIFFDFPALHGGQVAERIRLMFRAGRVVNASAAHGEEFLRAMLRQDAGASILGEVGLGCNYTLTRPTGQTLLDEKIGGTCHVALGRADPATGGQNQSALHWDLICDLRQGGQVELDGRVIASEGRFVASDWPQPEAGLGELPDAAFPPVQAGD